MAAGFLASAESAVCPVAAVVARGPLRMAAVWAWVDRAWVDRAWVDRGAAWAWVDQVAVAARGPVHTGAAYGGGMGGPGGGMGMGGPGGGMGMGGPGGGMGMGGPGGGMGGGGGGRGGMGGGGGNPEMMWAMLVSRTGGSGDSANLSLLPQASRDEMRMQSEQLGLQPLPEGVITKAQFMEHFNASSVMRRMQRNPGGEGNGNWNNGNMGPENWDGEKAEGDKEKGKGGKKEPEEKPVIALRYGKLPKDLQDQLPEWFETYDYDKDGQIALWEWRKAGQPIAEFEEYDLNKDGFITPDEYMRYKHKDAEERKLAALILNDGERPPPGAGRGRAGGPGGPGAAGGPRGRGGDPEAAATDKAEEPKKTDKSDKSDKTDQPKDKNDRKKGAGGNPWQNGGNTGDPPPRKSKN